jgi:3-phosphoshikimate 1-carboxyvinyltransferase
MSYESNYNPDTNTYHVPCLADKVSQPVFGQQALAGQILTVQVPGSKSITNRALLLATLAEGTSTLSGVLFSDDSRHFLKCVQDLGFETKVDEAQKTISVTGHGGAVPRKEASQYVGSAGTAARFLTAYLGVSEGCYHMDASGQMRKRPMAPLLDSLRELGCEILYEDSTREGFFPFTLKGHGFGKQEITVDINHSSQFLSALLIASCLSDEDFTVRVQGTHGMAYIEMTCRMMEQFGVHTERVAPDAFVTKKGQHYTARDYQIEPDVSAACYFYACAPLLHIPVLVENVHFESLQGDVAFLHILEQMGCKVSEQKDGSGILVLPPEDGFHGVTVDMSACSDQAITLAAIAPFADSPTTITGIGHIRFQESDRIHAIVTELGKMGIRCEEDKLSDGSITIYPGAPKPCVVDTYDDHRMAMGFSLIGLRAPGIAIHDPGCCRKTFENYFQVLEDVISRLS